MSVHVTDHPDTAVLVADLVAFLETGIAREGLFADDVFVDLTLPLWRVQFDTAESTIRFRLGEHPGTGQVRVERVEQTGHGFTLEVEERWEQAGERWYCREMMRADVRGGSIAELAIYCTGDWDEARQREHRESVRLLHA
ncbi:conserved hypothetical protein [metagenome]|uniref:SnoaL-like domain-containing protein n=1 Tax=metagenome TaxID=256318 RepID=A0A2P2C1D3_9ZZZZ